MFVYEILSDAVEFDNPLLAHTIYYAIQKQLITPNDKFSMDAFDALTDNDYWIISDMVKDDYLKMRIIKLFAVPLNQKEFAFYLSKSHEDIEAIHFKHFKKKLTKLVDAYRMMDHILYFEDKKSYESFRDIAKQTIDFPSFVCVLESR